MQEPRLVRLGKVTVRDGDIQIDPEPEIEVEARPGERLLLALFYDFREGSQDREHVRLDIHARLGERKEEAVEHIGDRPIVVDDRRGYFSVTLHAPQSGTAVGSAEVRGEYAVQEWVGDGDRTATPVRATVPLRVRVR